MVHDVASFGEAGLNMLRGMVVILCANQDTGKNKNGGRKTY
jgi:hypothetical protein